MGELVTLHCWGRLSVLPEVDDVGLGKGYLCRHPTAAAGGCRRHEGTDLGTVGYRGYICRHPNTRPGRLVGLRPVCPGHHMVPERLVGLRLVCSGLRGSRGTAGRCCGQCVREILPRVQRAMQF